VKIDFGHFLKIAILSIKKYVNNFKYFLMDFDKKVYFKLFLVC